MKLPNIITVSGLPACGKSTIARLLAKKYGYRYLHAGSFFRAIAKEKKMTLEEFEILCSKEPKYDIEIDKKMVRFVKNHKRVVYDGHISGWICQRNKVKSYKLWIKVPKETRAMRYSGREKITKNKALGLINHREKFLKKRYRKLYNIDYYDQSVYNLIVDGKPLPRVIITNIGQALKTLTN